MDRIISFVVIVPLFFVISCGPDLSKVNLSGCMKDCNEIAKECLTASNEKIITCEPDDDECILSIIHESELCLTTCLDCISICVEDLENILK